MLTPQLTHFLQSAFPDSAQIVDLQSYRPGYLFFPARVTVQQADGTLVHSVLKLHEQLAPLRKETKIAAMFNDFGLPVAQALAGPIALSDHEQFQAAILWSELPGASLPWVNLKSLDEAYLTYRLLRQGVLTLHGLTERVRQHPLAAELPVRTLQAELEQTIAQAGRWLEIEIVKRTVAALQQVIPTIKTELVFSNGDYNAINFLHQDGHLSGFVDFEFTCFEDPYIGFSKMIFWSFDDYGWGAGLKAGIVERFLYDQGVSKRDFAPRLALRAFSQVMRDVSLDKPEDRREMEYVLGVMEECLRIME